MAKGADDHLARCKAPKGAASTDDADALLYESMPKQEARFCISKGAKNPTFWQVYITVSLVPSHIEETHDADDLEMGKIWRLDISHSRP